MEHTDAAQIAALAGALGVVLVMLPRDRLLPLLGFALLGLATAGLGRSLIGDDDLELLFTDPAGLGLVGVAGLVAVLGAIPLARYPAASSLRGAITAAQPAQKSCRYASRVCAAGVASGPR